MKRMIAAVLALSLLPLLAQAQAYKCRQGDGSLSFQDHPCPSGASETPVDLAPVQGYAAVPLGHVSGESTGPAMGGTGADQPARMNTDNEALQAEVVRFRTLHPNWERDARLRRLEARSEAQNARAQAENRRAGVEMQVPAVHTTTVTHATASHPPPSHPPASHAGAAHH